MELKIVDGDYVADGAGGLVRVSGTEEVLQRVRFRLCARRGGFPLLPELGSELHRLGRVKPRERAGAARQAVAEALAAEQDVSVTAVELKQSGETAELHVTLRYRDEEAALMLPLEGA